jgi:hypothetical protein
MRFPLFLNTNIFQYDYGISLSSNPSNRLTFIESLIKREEVEPFRDIEMEVGTGTLVVLGTSLGDLLKYRFYLSLVIAFREPKV